MSLKSWLKKMDDPQYQTKMLVVGMLILFLFAAIGVLYAQIRMPSQLRGGVYNKLNEISYAQAQNAKDIEQVAKDVKQIQRNIEMIRSMLKSAIDIFR